MVISSRTPEGDPNHCPICGLDFRLEPSLPARDGPCPGCGHLLWFPDSRDAAQEKDRPKIQQIDTLKQARQSILWMGARRFGPPSPEVRQAVEDAQEFNGLKDLFNRILTASSWGELVRDG